MGRGRERRRRQDRRATHMQSVCSAREPPAAAAAPKAAPTVQMATIEAASSSSNGTWPDPRLAIGGACEKLEGSEGGIHSAWLLATRLASTTFRRSLGWN